MTTKQYKQANGTFMTNAFLGTVAVNGKDHPRKLNPCINIGRHYHRFKECLMVNSNVIFLEVS